MPGLGKGVEIVFGEEVGEQEAVVEKGNKNEGSKGVRVKDVKEGSREGGVGGGGKGRIGSERVRDLGEKWRSMPFINGEGGGREEGVAPLPVRKGKCGKGEGEGVREMFEGAEADEGELRG